MKSLQDSALLQLRRLFSASMLPAVLTGVYLGLGGGLFAFQPDIPLGTILGRILPPSGEKTLPNELTVMLVMRSRGISIEKEVHSGMFEFVDLEDGNYTIKVAARGYRELEEAVAVAGSDRGVVIEVSIQLDREADREPGLPPANGESTVSRQWLAIPRKAVAEVEKAAEASRKGDVDRAIAHLQKALRIFPAFAQALNNLGVQYLKRGDSELAVETFHRVLEIHPDDPSASFNLGMLCALQDRDEEAASFFETVLRLDSENSRAVAYLAESRFKLGNFERALEGYRRAIQLEPEQFELLLRVADCLTQLSRFGEAVETLRDFLRKTPGHPLTTTIRDQIRRLEAFPGTGL